MKKNIVVIFMVYACLYVYDTHAAAPSNASPQGSKRTVHVAPLSDAEKAKLSKLSTRASWPSDKKDNKPPLPQPGIKFNQLVPLAYDKHKEPTRVAVTVLLEVDECNHGFKGDGCPICDQEKKEQPVQNGTVLVPKKKKKKKKSNIVRPSQSQ
jgi:hypothetical protein